MVADRRLTQWVETYSSDMFSWAIHKVSDTELAKDLVQDTFMAATEKIEGFKGDSSLKNDEIIIDLSNFKKDIIAKIEESK
ncbi:MAG TPA: sigma factor [Bacteroidales bacterium]|nr:sigma factor [Bacteroidales bacterium]